MGGVRHRVLLLLIITIAAAGFGYVVFRRMRAPNKTIESVTSLKSVIPGRSQLEPGSSSAHPQLPPVRSH